MTDIETVPLKKPILLNGDNITQIKLRSPTASDLRGLALGGILRQEIDSFRILLPRICVDAQLTSEDLDRLSPFDLMEVVATAWLFFQPPGSPATS